MKPSRKKKPSEAISLELNQRKHQHQQQLQQHGNGSKQTQEEIIAEAFNHVKTVRFVQNLQHVLNDFNYKSNQLRQMNDPYNQHRCNSDCIFEHQDDIKVNSAYMCKFSGRIHSCGQHCDQTRPDEHGILVCHLTGLAKQGELTTKY